MEVQTTMEVTRRQFLQTAGMAAAGLALGECIESPVSGGQEDRPMVKKRFDTRGVVIAPADLTLADWPERAANAGLNVIGLHDGFSPSKVAEFIKSKDGQSFLARCRRLGLDVEYEIHAMSELLPRRLFAEKPDLFRMNDTGERTADTNLCVHSEEALKIVCENAVAICKVLKPTTHRYFLWFDDNQPGCKCPRCRDFSDSDQALIVENRILAAIRAIDSKAQLAHLAYGRTMDPPKTVKPSQGIFLEFAPFNRNHKLPLSDAANKPILDALDANLKVFKPSDARALEYWLDVSLFSSWKKPAVRVDLNEHLLRDDLAAYAQRGIRQVTTFAVYIDADYESRYGAPPIAEYGRALSEVSHGKD